MGSIIEPDYLQAVPIENKFAAFTTLTHTYKVVAGHPILVDVAIPNKFLDNQVDALKKAPVCIRLHGGWLIGGQRDTPSWNATWILQLLLKHGAIYVQPDYRLIPEARGEDILDDIDDFWTWLGNDLPSILLEYGIQPILDRVFVTGESSGGYLSIQTALSFSKPPSEGTPRVSVVLPNYPMLYLRSPHYTGAYEKKILGYPQISVSVVNEQLASIARAAKRPVATCAPLADAPRGAFAVALIQHGRYIEALGEERDPTPGKRRLHPEDRVADGQKLPPTLLLQGIDDSATPVGYADEFIELLREKKAVNGLEEGSDVLLYIREPGEHGFNNDMKIGDLEWIEGAVSFIEKYWIE